MEEFLIYALLGVSVAITSNFLGLGGGVILGPVLIGFMDKDVHWSLGVSLSSAFLVTLTNTVRFHRKGHVPWGLVLRVALPAVICAVIAASFAQEVSPQHLQILLGSVLSLLGLYVLYQKVFLPMDRQSIWYSGWVFVLLGALSGSLSGFTGVGAGLIFMPLYLTARQVELGRAVACSNASMVFSTAFGAGVYLFHQWQGGGDLKAFLMPVFIISVVSWTLSRFMGDFQGALAEKVRVGLILLILFLLGGYTLYQVNL